MPTEFTSRRQFLQNTAGAAASAAVVARALGAADAPGRSFRAAVIGHTGRGDYGHGMDVVFAGVPGVEVVALADGGADFADRSKHAERVGVTRHLHYEDYRQMLRAEKPHLVSIAPRWTDQHHAMAMAALAAGAHLVMEKPFTETPAQADEVLSVADRGGKKIAVAHQMRMAPGVVRLKQAVDEGQIGDLLQVDAWGKQDRRAGGEDMLVLGTHLFDLMRLFAGDPRWCTARVLHEGREISAADARPATEAGIGPVAGDEVFAQFGFDRGVNATFTSRAKLREMTGHWGIELTGSKGSARVLADISPRVFIMTPQAWSDGGRTDAWRPLESPPGGDTAAANRRIVDDWLEAIRMDRQPKCSGRNAAAAVEMVMAVYRAALTRSREPLPLKERGHPLVPR